MTLEPIWVQMPTNVQLVTSGEPSSSSCKLFSSYKNSVLGEAQGGPREGAGKPMEDEGGPRAP